MTVVRARNGKTYTVAYARQARNGVYVNGQLWVGATIVAFGGSQKKTTYFRRRW